MNKIENIHLEKTWKSFFYTVIGVTLPFLLSLIPIITLSEYKKIVSFLDDGQFLLFGAGLYTSSHFLFTENSKSVKLKKDKVLCNIVFWALIFCSSFYAILYLVQIIDYKSTINLLFVRIGSVILYFLAIYSIYRGIYVDSLKVYPEIDIKKETKQEVDNILDQL